MHGFQIIIGPFRIKSVEPLRVTTIEERRAKQEETGFNLVRPVAHMLDGGGHR
jgi:hypothetical protein